MEIQQGDERASYRALENYKDKKIHFFMKD